MGLFSLQKRKLKGSLLPPASTLSEDAEKMEKDSCQRCTEPSHERQGYRLEHGKCWLGLRTFSSTMMVAKHWRRLPREAIESPPMEVLSTGLDAET